MKCAVNLVKRFVREEKGLETVEYAIIAALITLAAITAIATLGGLIANKFEQLVSFLQ